MNITKRLYTYPVLSEERDDYTDSVFDADVQYKMNGVNNLLFDFGIEMDNKELQKMILEGDAEYVVHIECTNTSYRTTIHDISNHVSKEISIGRINGRIEIIVLIVTKKDVNHFVNSNWNEDYRGLSCCNCVNGNCLLLDDGEEHNCVQLISKYGVYCNYFKNAVLPADKELFADVMKTCNEKHCRICGKVFIPKSKNQRYCTE